MRLKLWEEELSITQDKPIRPMVIEFDTQEEYDAFIEYSISTNPDNSEGMQRLREMMKNHKRAKEGRPSSIQDLAKSICDENDGAMKELTD